MIYCVYKVHWTEYERGFGQRPDGTSFHKNLKDANKFIEEMSGGTRDNYYKASEPILHEVDVLTYDQIQNVKYFWAHNRKHV